MASEQEGREPQEMPRELQRDLEAVFGGAPAVPAAVERESLRRASRTLAWYRRRRLLTRVLPLGAAAAAAVVAFLHFGATPGDLNGDGRVDILDAFRLARRLESPKPPPAAWDLDGDGRVDREDVRRAAARAVHLGGEG